MPSGTLWATCNIGANSPEEDGLYFAWGETQGYTAEQVGVDKNFDSDATDYKFGSYDSGDTTNYGMAKYNNTDGKKILDSEDDAAAVNWGSGWRMPSMSEAEELQSNTTSAITQNGVLLTSRINGNTLYMPFNNIVNDGAEQFDRQSYQCWTAELTPLADLQFGRIPYVLTITDRTGTFRFVGCMVRPVRNA